MGAFQGVQNSQLQALQGQTSGDLYYLQLVGDMGARGSGRRGFGEREERGEDVIMRDVDGNGPVDVKVSFWSLLSILPIS